MTTPHPTEGELAILQVLWERGAPCTVREVHAALSRAKDTAYTTVLKMMTIMADKGLLRRDESERSHRSAAAHPQPEVQATLVKDLMQRAFAGTAQQQVQRAQEVDAPGAAEHAAIEPLIAQARAARARKR